MEFFFCHVIFIWHAKRSPFFFAYSTTGGGRGTRGGDGMRKNEGPTEWNARVEENDDYILEWKRRKQKRNTIPDWALYITWGIMSAAIILNIIGIVGLLK